MKRINSKYIRLAILSILIVPFACTERIELELDETNARLAIEGQITTDTTRHYVILTRSGDALNRTEKKYITGALVTLNDGSNTMTLAENPSKPGYYETADSVYGVPGRTYTVNIQNVDINNDNVLEEYSASSTMKKMLPIDKIEIQGRTFGRKGWFINLFAQDIGGGRNFYMIKAYKNNVLLTDSTFEIGFADNLGFEGEYYDGLSVYMLSDRKEDERLQTGDTITLELSAIDHGYYYFLMDFISEYYPKLPIFSGPSANITTNITPKNKGIGYFSAYSIERKSIIFN